jgi:hypothetical protein
VCASAYRDHETGGVLRRGTRPFEVVYTSRRVVVDLPGWYPDRPSDGVHVRDDMAAVDEALRRPKREIDARRG